MHFKIDLEKDYKVTSNHNALLNLLPPHLPSLPQHPLLQYTLLVTFHLHRNACRAYALKEQLYIMDFKLSVPLSALKVLHSSQGFMYLNT